MEVKLLQILIKINISINKKLLQHKGLINFIKHKFRKVEYNLKNIFKIDRDYELFIVYMYFFKE